MVSQIKPIPVLRERLSLLSRIFPNNKIFRKFGKYFYPLPIFYKNLLLWQFRRRFKLKRILKLSQSFKEFTSSVLLCFFSLLISNICLNLIVLQINIFYLETLRILYKAFTENLNYNVFENILIRKIYELRICKYDLIILSYTKNHVAFLEKRKMVLLIIPLLLLNTEEITRKVFI